MTDRGRSYMNSVGDIFLSHACEIARLSQPGAIERSGDLTRAGVSVAVEKYPQVDELRSPVLAS